ncbi:hypothetical protein P691DRAFT_798349 [Macrolepiota fuliginosa MF-IS2]|uniref:RRM domain-containing protein n=1 Tax=Macrolepiota fuliginosa MF-IS2 TaxID=1400762 RepID=A0A9P6C6I9_9AGAR|nr:hypothetical protein P691DRAFT_798349 [Macrolepiota fuliginosa MF-IS2]
MDDLPYTTPEEDPFNVRPLPQQYPRRRRSSMFEKWIEEQQRYSIPGDPSSSTDTRVHTRSQSNPATHAYLAYPELNRSSLNRTGPAEDAASESGYDLVDDDDIPTSLAADFHSLNFTDAAATIRTSKRNSRMSLSPTSFRHFNLTFRSPNSPVEDSPSRPSSRISIFSRSNRNSTGTITGRGTITPNSSPQKPRNRSSRIATNSTTINNHDDTYSSHPSPCPRTPPPVPVARSSSSSKWRPSVLGHFTPSSSHSRTHAVSQSSIHPPPSDTNYAPSRPSVSSSIDTSHAHTSTVALAPVRRRSLTRLPRPRSPNTVQRTWALFAQRGVGNDTRPPSRSSINIIPPPLEMGYHTSNMATFPRMYPYVYNNGVQTSARRGAGAFDGIHSSTHALRASTEEEEEEEDLESGRSQRPVGGPRQPPPQQPAKKKKPHVVYSSQNGGTLSRMTSLSNIALAPMIPRSRKKKKKLVVSGVATNDTKKFEGVKRWCESFGEVRQILRMPNGDLVVSFQSSEVADTVCRVRAKVFINGVGSVQLSWTTDKKR